MTREEANEKFVRYAQRLLGVKEDGWAGRDTEAAFKARLGLSETVEAGGDIPPGLIEELKRDEGLRLKAYPDPLSGGDPWTVGYGATGPDIRKGTVWTKEKAEKRLVEMVLDHGRRLEAKAPWVANLDPVRRRVLWNMAYNLGVEGLLDFKNTLQAVKDGRYGMAATGMLASLWARQVGQRAQRLALAMSSGV